MNHQTDADLIERALERAAKEPDRVGALKRLVRGRLNVPRTPPPVPAADPWDDYPWDNVPV